MKKFAYLILLFPILVFGNNTNEDKLMKKAEELAQKILIIDTHIDVPYRMLEHWEDISQITVNGDFDYPRAVKGGLNVPFMSVYIPAKYQKTGGAKKLADKIINLVNSFQEKWPDKFVVATDIDSFKKYAEEGKICLPMGMENGAPIEGDLNNVKYFYDKGIRYITLTHGKNNHICDSSYDDEEKWNGLSPFGKKLIAEMNRVGMIIDVSHISDKTFYQVIELTKAPVVATHSSCRFYTPGFERNMNDDMIKKLGANGGVIQINFGSTFLRGDLREKSKNIRSEINKWNEEHQLKSNDPKAVEHSNEYRSTHKVGYADVTDVVEHIEHVINLVGIDHVGIGSDFDGLGDSLPNGLKDVSQYPNIIYHLLKKGYSEEDIEKIFSGNLIRVWKEIDKKAKEMQKL